MRRSIYLLTTILSCTVVWTVTLAQVPRTISFQGVLLDEAGDPRPDGNYELMLSLYDQASRGPARSPYCGA